MARTDDRRRVDVIVTDAAKELGWAFFGPVIDTTRTVLAARAPAERAVVDTFLDDLVDALRDATSATPPALGTTGSR